MPMKNANIYIYIYIYKRISSGAQYVKLQKYFSHPSFSYLTFFQTRHKTKIGTANRWGEY
jgi:hypothetical protein